MVENVHDLRQRGSHGDILDTLQVWYLICRISRFQNVFFLGILCFSPHREESVKCQWPLTTSQPGQTGKHETEPLIPQNLYSVPTRVQGLSLQRTECNICFLLTELTLKQIGPGSLLCPLPNAPHPASFDLQGGMLIFPLSVQDKQSCDTRRSSECGPPDPEQRTERWRQRCRNLRLAPRS